MDIDEQQKNKIYKSELRVLFTDSKIENWNLEFIDLIDNDKVLRRDSNGLSGCLNIYDSKIKNSKIFTKNTKCEDAVNFVRTDGTISNLIISKSLFDGLIDFSNLIIKNAEVNYSGNDCMDFSYGEYHLSEINLSMCNDKAVSIGESSKLKIDEFVIKDSIVGIASKDSAIANLKNGLIQNVINVYHYIKRNKSSMEDFRI